ncbi:sex peptide receptor-like [Dreissena polymorpha]|uniref:G-protein coupled receptors family 1 profile domain-containing protein n=1 Tax=Dreissena polymorpha TaxID=45954 RepID=A0A9D4GMW7_DREPO|nr:sex peptide receptor-like [Dreissena polymorpha]XP_052284525.1 sex peptide receptor-like [Dreissena polymorpha]XP_052284526.1 sex peptide receptor-like [Dreissena polymorpha]XP_052284527.1 sex peptide receptor-like [Dreissena polymorpha]XP_052284528.1 sex peptide receptor-like [Dreissena polymorpha]XP_052284530.1 sex peptide receptor-like [Dreissena polymorpha]XP_052284531.1 sex peptide receptor-like [Dreissena polymorpha]XP_052284532.1 sex peptide receptor-like [Dreissena polymorpha]KAH
MTTRALWNTSQMFSPTENGSSSLKTSASLVMTMSSHLLEISTALFPTASADYNDPEGSSDNTNFGKIGSGMFANDSNNISHSEQQIYEYYMYGAFAFEIPIYLYIWEILVIITALVNGLVIMVLLRKKMRNPTNMILAAIAIADTLTGLVTLPTYIMVYQNFEEATDSEQYSDGFTNETEISAGNNYEEYAYMANGSIDIKAMDAYKLSKSLCTWFMLSKFFFSKLFHTCSIFLTLFLGIQRFVSVAYPFLAGKIFTNRTVVITCVCIFIVSPLIYIYHVFKEKASEFGLCQWAIDECKTDCVYLWAVLFIRHFILIALLSIFTILFIIELRKTKCVGGSREQVARRDSENNRITKIVISILIVVLIPELPYGVFLMMSAIYKHTDRPYHLETNRAIHAAYELALIVSFHSNFYIYTFLNKRFRSGLKRTVTYPIRRVMGDQYRWSVPSPPTAEQQRNQVWYQCQRLAHVRWTIKPLAKRSIKFRKRQRRQYGDKTNERQQFY